MWDFALICIFLILLQGTFTKTQLTKYPMPSKLLSRLRQVHLCCDFNQFRTKLGCVSSYERNDVDSLWQLFGHKLNCTREFVQNIKVNTSFLNESNQYFLADEESTRIFVNDVSYPRKSYCVYNIEHPDILSLIICSPGCTDDIPCVRKCCAGWNRSLMQKMNGKYKCEWVEPGDSTFARMFDSKSVNGGFNTSKFIMAEGIQSCEGHTFHSTTDFRMFKNGTLEAEDYDSPIQKENYCLEETFHWNSNSSILYAYSCSPHTVNNVAELYTEAVEYYSIENKNSLGLRLAHTCCDVDMLYSQLSCIMPPDSNDPDSLRQRYGDRLKCQNGFIENIQFNASYDPESPETPYVESGGSRRIFIGGISYPGDAYCVHNIQDLPHNLSLLICSPGCSAVNPCHKKCCDWGNSFVDFACTPIETEYSKFSELFDSKTSFGTFNSAKFTVRNIFSFTGVCGTSPDTRRNDFWISSDGILKIGIYEENSAVDVVDFCVEESFDENDSSSELVAFYCNNELLNNWWATAVLYLTYSVISSVFSGASVVVFFIIRSDHSIHGCTQFAFLIFTFLGDLSQAIRRSFDLYLQSTGINDLPLISFITRVGNNFFAFGLMTNIVNMNAHLFWTFLKSETPKRRLSCWEDLRSLALSVAASWIVAAIFTTVCENVWNETESENIKNALLTASVIKNTMWGLTLLLVLGTAFIILNRLRERSSIRSTRSSGLTQSVVLMARLFCITGVVWSLDLLNVLFTKDGFRRGWLFYIVDFITFNNGVILFFVIVCNRNILQRLTKRFTQRATTHLGEILRLRGVPQIQNTPAS